MKPTKFHMKVSPVIVRYFVPVLIAVLLSVQGAAAHACPVDGPLVFAADDYPPYQVIADDTVAGMDIAVLGLVFSRMGCDMTVEVMPWPRQLNGVRSGAVDVISPATWTEERASFATFSVPYLVTVERLFVLSGRENAYADLRSFFERGGRLGVMRAYAYGGEFEEFRGEFSSQIDETDELAANIRKIDAGRLDATIGDERVMKMNIRNAGMEGRVVPGSVKVSSYPLFFMFSKESIPEDFVAKFNLHLSELQDSGQLDEITARY